MLFKYNNKIYIRPFANKIVEVIIRKQGTEYSIEPTSNKIELTADIANELYSIPLEEAYKIQNKSNIKEKIK